MGVLSGQAKGEAGSEAGQRSASRIGNFRALVVGAMIAAFSALFLVQSQVPEPDRTLVSDGTAVEKSLDVLRAMPDPDRDLLVAREQAILKSNQLDIQALKNLALLAEARGDKARAASLTILAGDRNLRDIGTQAAVLSLLMERKDYAGALYRYDGLMRARPERAEELLPGVASFAADPSRMAALVGILKTDPPWRAKLIDHVTADSFDVTVAYQLLAALRQAGSPVTSTEMSRLMIRLIRQKSFDKAYFIWLDSLTEPELRRAKLVFDGEFVGELENRLFDWTSTAVKNAELVLAPRAAGSVDRVARVNFVGFRENFAHFFQYLRLAPGNYLLTGEAKAEELTAGAAMVWEVMCVDDQPTTLATSPATSGSAPWATFEAGFTVPPQGCMTQLLRLTLKDNLPASEGVSGRVFYDNINISKRD